MSNKQNECVRIAQFPGVLNGGGVQSVIMNWYRHIDRSKIQFDFYVTRDTSAPIDKEIQNLGGRVFHIPTIHSVGIIRYLKCVVNQLSNNGPYKAVHVHCVHVGVINIIAAKIAGVKNRFFHVHNTKDAALDHLPFSGIIELFLSYLIIIFSTKKFACGKDAGKYVYGGHEHEIINNAIDTKVFYPYGTEKRKEIRDSLGISEGSIVIGNIARFVKEKNQMFFTKLASVEHKSNIVFLLVGDGSEMDIVKKECERIKCLDKFIFTGSQRNTPDYYNAMDVFCLPSFFEGLPVTLIEAQACGLPCVISSNVSLESDLNIVKFESLSLVSDITIWIEHLVEASSNKIDDKDVIEKALVSKGYEIVTVAHWIQSIYLSI